MRTREMFTRVAAGAAGAVLLVGVAGAAFADDDPGYGTDDVDVNVQIDEAAEPGVLAMTVAGDATSLTESGSTPTVRQFTGTLPTVTVTDTRVFPDRLDPGAYWYVLGTSSDFIGDAAQPDIPAGHLGWTPALVAGTYPARSPPGPRRDRAGFRPRRRRSGRPGTPGHAASSADITPPVPGP